MATYKVIQDVEAEDKLIGPLTFRQFVYAGAAVLLGYLSFLLITHDAGFMAIVFIPMSLVSGFFAWPWGRDQPTEVWALAKIRFLFKPRRRIWDQSGVKELVTITVPRKIEVNYTNGLSQSEVKSRLKVLADTIDSRGWAIKNVDINLYTQPNLMTPDQNSDRLVSIQNMPQAVPAVDVQASDDILDNKNNPIARQFDTMIAASTKAHRQQIINHLQETGPQSGAPTAAAPANDNHWFLSQPAQPAVSTSQDAVTFNTQVVTPGASVASLPVAPANPTPDEEALIEKLDQHGDAPVNTYAHLHTIQPLSAQAQLAKQQAELQRQAAPKQQKPPVTQPTDAGILDLARNDDLNVATIAREAQKRRESPQDEVVISLH
jgi:hypothetical protein